METFKTSTIKPLLQSEQKIFSWTIALFAFLLPLFFLPLTAEFYLFNKTILLYFVVGLLLAVWAIKIFFEQKLSLRKNSLNGPVLSLMLAYLLSAFIQAPNRMESLTSQAGVVLALGLLYFIMVNHLRGKEAAAKIMASFLVSLLVLSGLTLLAALNILPKTGLAWLQSRAWTPTGSVLTTINLILIFLPATLYWAWKNKKPLEKIFLFLTGGLGILSLAAITALFLDKTLNFTYLLPQYGWQISVEGLKNLRTALFGVGPGNFLSAFSRFRPIELNNTSLWAMKFTTNSNQYLHLLSTVGLLGLAGYLWLVWQSLKKENWQGSLMRKVIYLCLAAGFISQLVLAANLLTLGVTLMLAGLLAATQSPQKTDQPRSSLPQAAVWGIAAAAAVLILAVFYWEGRVWLADYYFRRSLLAAQENKGLETYNFQLKAINLNPFKENYRVSYSNTNLALANGLASQADLTDQKKANINQLISQAIREAKAATSLNPQISDYWINLAVLYRNLINAAEEAGQWATASYLQAVRTDPTNPLLRVEFGGLFYALEDYDRAINQFIQSVNLKPDYANGYYNLSVAYRAKEDWQNAFQNMQLVLSLIPLDSPDYQKASAELEELRAKLPTPPQQASGSAQLKEEEKLKEPAALSSPRPGFDKVILPEEAGPEIPEEASGSAEESKEATSAAKP
jgi:hypothetical protein